MRNRLTRDLNGDGEGEVIVLFFDPDIAPGSPLTEADLHRHLTCNGFAVLTEVDGAWWPVFHQFDEYRMRLRLGQVEGLPMADEQLIGDHAGTRTIWGWEHTPGQEDDNRPRWHSKWRPGDARKNAFSSTWHRGWFYGSNVGK